MFTPLVETTRTGPSFRTGIATADAFPRWNGIGTFSRADIDVDIRRQRAGGITHQDPVCHGDIVIPGEPILGRQLVARITHHFVEAISI